MSRYGSKSDAELAFIIKDAGEAAACARELRNSEAEGKYLDQVSDAASERYRRAQKQHAGRRGVRAAQLLAA